MKHFVRVVLKIPYSVGILYSVVVQIEHKPLCGKRSACCALTGIVVKSGESERIGSYCSTYCTGSLNCPEFSISVAFKILLPVSDEVICVFIIFRIPEVQNIFSLICRKNQTLLICVRHITFNLFEFFGDNGLLVFGNILFVVKNLVGSLFKITNSVRNNRF